MAPVALLDPQPGERILDLCAAPGGKTTQIAGRMMGDGFLLCNEINPKRAKILSRNIERMAVANALVTNEHPANLAKRFPGFFDRVLVDAPGIARGPWDAPDVDGSIHVDPSLPVGEFAEVEIVDAIAYELFAEGAVEDEI